MKYKIVIIILVLFLFTISACSREPLLTLNGGTMGTWYTIKVCGVSNDDEKDRIVNTVENALKSVNKSMNHFDPESEISGFNDFEGPGVYPLSHEFLKVAKLADSIYGISSGAFDPTVGELVSLWGFGKSDSIQVPSQADLDKVMKYVGMNKLHITEEGIIREESGIKLDFSAIAKGYGVDAVATAISGLGYNDLLVEIGGEVKALGNRFGKLWRIGIASPGLNERYDQNTLSVISLKNMACATSGDYRQYYEMDGKRYSHLIDPKTGYPIDHELTSVTVTAESCMLADALATAVIVMGKKEGMELIESMENVEALFIFRDRDGKLRSHASSNWEKHL